MTSISPLTEEPFTIGELQAYIDQGFLRHDYQRLRNKAYFFVEHWRARRILKQLNRKRIESFLQNVRTESTPIRLQPFKIIQLAYWIRRLRPKIICEFGAGGSTILFAELLEHLGIEGEIISLEQNKEWHDRVNAAIPEELRHRIDVRFCPTTYERIRGYRCLSYDLPDMPKEIDFAYIDGPSPQENTPLTEDHPFFNGDLYNLAQKGIVCRFAVNDGRWFNLGFYRNELGDLYRFKPTVRYRSFLIEHRAIQPGSWAWSRFLRTPRDERNVA